jgi:ornithine carbamoyltransferase
MVTFTAPRVDDETDFDPLSPADAAAILDSARELLLAAGQGQTNAALKGKHLGLMCVNEAQQGDVPKADAESTDAAFFRLAATRLGAHVARIRPRLSAGSSVPELRRLSLMLGRLYHAVECQGMSLDLVKKIRAQAGVPVYFKLASANHPTAALADQLEGNASLRDKRLYVLQAVLLRTARARA